MQNLAAWAVAGTAAYILWIKPEQKEQQKRVSDDVIATQHASPPAAELRFQSRPAVCIVTCMGCAQTGPCIVLLQMPK